MLGKVINGQGCLPLCGLPIRWGGVSRDVHSCTLGYSQGAGYMNFSGFLLSREFLIWLRPTPLAPVQSGEEVGGSLFSTKVWPVSTACYGIREQVGVGYPIPSRHWLHLHIY